LNSFSAFQDAAAHIVLNIGCFSSVARKYGFE